jgi:hypothetical protein
MDTKESAGSYARKCINTFGRTRLLRQRSLRECAKSELAGTQVSYDRAKLVSLDLYILSYIPNTYYTPLLP